MWSKMRTAQQDLGSDSVTPSESGARYRNNIGILSQIVTWLQNLAPDSDVVAGSGDRFCSVIRS